MTGYRPGHEARRDHGEPRGPRRTLGPYGPRDVNDPDPADARYDAPPAHRPDRHGAPRDQQGERYAAPASHRAGRYGAPPDYPAERYGAQPGGPRSPARPWERPGPARRAVPRDNPGSGDRGGAEGNERLTAATGAVLLVLFAAEGFTILSIHQLITVHFFLGMLLIGPVALKIGTVVYRFTRYYTGAPEYRRKGPPAPLLRLLGPFVVITSVGVIGTGVMLAVTGSAAGPWLFLHKAFFVLWFGAMTIHVLAYVWRLPRLIGADVRGPSGFNRAQGVLAGRTTRWLLLAASLAGGLLIAAMTVHLASPWTGLHYFG